MKIKLGNHTYHMQALVRIGLALFGTGLFVGALIAHIEDGRTMPFTWYLPLLIAPLALIGIGKYIERSE